jgi:hypothetical protein
VTLSNVKLRGKAIRLKTSTRMARRNRTWAGVNFAAAGRGGAGGITGKLNASELLVDRR